LVDSLLVLIREARESDLPGLEWEGAFSHFRGLYQRAFLETQSGRRIMLVAEADSQVVGQLFIQLDSFPKPGGDGRATAYLYSFRVRPEYRKQGIGTQLIQAAETRLQTRGYRRAVISVAVTNLTARKLYEHLGYRVYAQDPGQWSYIDDQGQLQRVDEPALVLEKEL
jgi:ribosomal protein S18 acetylase RimI-like enzyme